MLAGISISALTGEGGLINKAIKAKEESNIEEKKEEVTMALQEELLEYGRR